jgi:hypothetical protein
VTGKKVNWIINTRDPAARFNSHNTLLEETLAPSSADNCLSVCLLHRRISFNLLFEPAFPDVEIVARHDSAIFKGSTSPGSGDQ